MIKINEVLLTSEKTIWMKRKYSYHIKLGPSMRNNNRVLGMQPSITYFSKNCDY